MIQIGRWKMKDILIMELFFALGISIFVITNFIVNIYFGLYTLALVCMAYSIFMYRTRGRSCK